MKSLPIGSFCKTGSGGTPSRSKIKEYYEGGDIPWIKSGELAQDTILAAEESITQKAVYESSAKVLAPGAILVAMYGATVGQVSRLRIAAATNQAICHIYPDTEVCEPDYLYRVLKGAKDRLLAKRVGGGQPNISQTIIREIPIPLPPLAEQKRIVAILDAADALRAKRRESLAQLGTLLQSTFLELFGDPVTNPKGWEQRLLGSICDVGSSKRVFVNELVETGVPFFRGTEIGQLGDGRTVVPSLFITKEHYETLKAYSGVPQRGDLLLPSICEDGRIYSVKDDTPFYFKDGRVLWIKVHGSQIVSTFLKTHLKQIFAKDYAKIASGTTFAELKIFALKDLLIHVPPINQQLHFATITESIERQKTRLRTHLAELDALFASLQSRAFNGQL